jgi:hypothetical protein
VAGRTYLDLQNLARRQRRPTDELHQLYALEGFLARLAVSPYADRLVLKGGVLLAAYDTRRPTRDVDLQGQRMSNNTDDVLATVRAIADIRLDDGLIFETATASAGLIRESDLYKGVRVTLAGRLAAARFVFHVDLNIGDPVWPAPQTIVLPRLLTGQIELAGYPLPMVYAEKIVTAVQRGTANTRWRDFADIYLLTGRHDVAGDELREAIVAVAAYRTVPLIPLRDILDIYVDLAQSRWTAWRRRQRLESRLPEQFSRILEETILFADPVLTDTVSSAVWLAAQRRWKHDLP